MKTDVSSAKGAQAKAVVLTGNGMPSKKEEVAVPLLLLPTAPVTKENVKVESEQDLKLETKEETMFKENLIQQETLITPKRLSIDELTDKADRVYLLKEKYKKIREKRKQLESFTISHENTNAQLTLIDANGLSISTSNPVAIGKLLFDWAIDLNNHLEKTECEIRSELDKFN